MEGKARRKEDGRGSKTIIIITTTIFSYVIMTEVIARVHYRFSW